MRRDERHIIYLVSALVDMAITVLCYLESSHFRIGTYTGVEDTTYLGWNRYSTLIVMVYAAIIVCAYAGTRVYGYTYYGRPGHVIGRILLVNSIGISLFAAMLYAWRLTDISRLTLLTFYATSTVAVIAKQLLIIYVLRRRRRNPDNRSTVLLVGSGSLALKYADVIAHDPTRYEYVEGYVSSTGKKEASRELGESFGLVDDLDALLATHDFDQMVIALESEEYAQVKTALAAANKYGIYVRIVPFYNELLPRNPAIESVQDIQLIDMRTTAIDNLFAATLKRLFDIVVSATILVLISPIMVIVAIGVKLSSPGPIFFSQERIGKDRKPFKMLKFRSMRVTPLPVSTFTEDKDARKTKFGSFIRKFSIDELPQFINVFIGQMSIVGPRPVVPEETATYMQNIPLYMLRYQVRPGITGWAQVNGYRGDPSLAAIEKRTQYDLYYVEHWSPWFDIKIFFRTIFGGFMNNEKIKK